MKKCEVNYQFQFIDSQSGRMLAWSVLLPHAQVPDRDTPRLSETQIGFTERPASSRLCSTWKMKAAVKTAGNATENELKQRALCLQIRDLKRKQVRPSSTPQPPSHYRWMLQFSGSWPPPPLEIISGVSRGGFLSPAQSEALARSSGEPWPSLSQEVGQNGRM